MERLVILDFETGMVDVYPIEYDYEPDMDELLNRLGHRANDCKWMFTIGEITIHSEVLKDDSKTTEQDEAYSSIVREAADNILEIPYSYLHEENAEVTEDIECPYGTFEGE